MKLVDTHAHLESLKDLGGAVERAEKIGVIAVVTMGSDHNSNLWSLEESSKYSGNKLKIYPSLGFHPWELDESKIDANLRLIEANIARAVALGEIGLDYWYKHVRKNAEKKELQKSLFRRLLEIAKKNDKPVSIHSRGAWADCVDICIEASVKKAVFHWFSGPVEVLERLLERGYYVSVTPAAAHSKEHRLTVEKAPLERLLLETDSPVPYGGEPSEPSHISKSLLIVSDLKNVSQERVADVTTENAASLFRLQL